VHSRSSDAAAGAAIEAGAERVLRAIAAGQARHPTVLVDGRSGAGKSTLAGIVFAALAAERPAQLVALDSIYPGWDGLAAGVERAYRGILLPRVHGRVGRWHRWDWVRGQDAEEHTVAANQALILEGCGALTRETAALADLTVWVESPATSRKARALTRDGEIFAPHWERWAAQEETHIARNDPRSLADLVIEVP